MATVREVRRDRVMWRPDTVEEHEVIESSSAQVVGYILTVIETLLLFRLAMKMFGANSANGFVDFIYDLTSPLIAPFQGIFPSPSESGAVFESATAVAMIVYAVVAHLIAWLLPTRSRRESLVDHGPDIR